MSNPTTPAADSISPRSTRESLGVSPHLTNTARRTTGEPLSVGTVGSSEVGRVINRRYCLTRLIGEGGMGIVYEAHDSQVDRKVAIKLVRDECRNDSKFMTRFRRELEVTSQLRHPSTIRVFEHGQDETGRPYMVMELLTGTSLATRLERGPLEEATALEYALQIAESLSEAHENGIFHRDLKPDNIFIETVGVSTVIKVLDFGIAGGLDASRLTRAGEVFGTPQYMSPEQCNGHALDHRTDIYSLGCILFEMVQGQPPFMAETPMATMLKHVRTKVPVASRASRETMRVMILALRKDKNKRIQDCAQFAQLLRSALSSARGNQDHDGAAGVLARLSEMPGKLTSGVPSSGSADRRTGATASAIGGQKIVMGVLGAGFVALMIALFSTSTSNNAANKKASNVAEPVLAAPPREEPADSDVSLRNRALITTSVPGASVYLNDEPVCTTPCRIEVPVGDGRLHTIRVEKNGYAPQVQNWQPKTVTEEPPPFPALRPTP